jgi:hypothetical protein
VAQLAVLAFACNKWAPILNFESRKNGKMALVLKRVKVALVKTFLQRWRCITIVGLTTASPIYE